MSVKNNRHTEKETKKLQSCLHSEQQEKRVPSSPCKILSPFQLATRSKSRKLVAPALCAAVCQTLTSHDPVGGAEPREHAVDGREPAGFRGHVAPQLGHDHQETSLHSKQGQAHVTSACSFSSSHTARAGSCASPKTRTGVHKASCCFNSSRLQQHHLWQD